MNLRIPDDVVFRVLGDEAVILNLASGVYFGLDTVGTRMWQLMSEHGSTDKVIAAMLDYPVSFHYATRRTRITGTLAHC